MTERHGPSEPGGPAQPGPPVTSTYHAGNPADVATPSGLTGRKLLLIILGLVAGCGVLVIGALGVAALLGVKLFEYFR
jgi:hypothetical protein